MQKHNIFTLLLIIGITVVGFLAWVGLLLLLWLGLRALGISTDLWAMIEALSTAIAAATVFTAGFVAYRELAELSNSRYLEVVDRLFEELNSAENIAARRWIFQKLAGDPAEEIAALPAEGRDAIKKVLNSLDRVAFLMQPGWVEEEKIMPWISPMVVKAWLKLAPYVEYERARRRETDFYRTAQRLAERCLAWRQKNIPDAQVQWLEDAL